MDNGIFFRHNPLMSEPVLAEDSIDLAVAAASKAEEQKYWKQKLSGQLERSHFPYDFPFKSVRECGVDYAEFSITGDLYEKLTVVSKESYQTLHVILGAGLTVLLNKYTNHNDIIIGTPIYRQEVEGDFTNTVLVLRTRLDDRLTFKDLLLQLRQTLIEAIQNQSFPINILVKELDISYQGENFPLFDVSFLLENIHDKGYLSHINHNMMLSFFKKNREIKGVLGYNTAAYARTTIERIIAHFKRLLQEVLYNREVPIFRIEFLSLEEKEQLLEEFNHTTVEYPREKTIQELFEEQVQTNPDRVAIVFKNEWFTYEQLSLTSNRLANYLRGSREILQAKCIGLMLDISIPAIVALLGILKSGAAYISINPTFPRERIKYMIADAAISTLISRKKYIKELNDLQWECPSLQTFLCMDSFDIYSEPERVKSELMSKKLWEYVGESAVDEITGGGWVNSYTGQPISKQEMDEYGDNILEKLIPLLNKKTRILEIGCSSGISMFRLAPRVGFYYGLDLSQVIIDQNEKRIRNEGLQNIKLSCLPAHEIDKVEEKDFDMVIINSVIQCFHGHNYLRSVLKKAVNLMGSSGWIFIGDVMDLELKEDLIRDLMEFKRTHGNQTNDYKTKIDWSNELFISRRFFDDLRVEIPVLGKVTYSGKIHTIENELTKFRFDVLLEIVKGQAAPGCLRQKQKYQHDNNALMAFTPAKVPTVNGPDSLAYIIFTSGSTGKPKGVMVNHRNVIRLVKNTNYLQCNPHDRLLQTGVLEFDASTFEIWASLLNGAMLYLTQKDTILSADLLKQCIDAHQINIIWLSSPLFNHLMNQDIDVFSGIKYLLVGGDVLVPKKINQLRWKFPEIHVINGYGPTENTTFSCTYSIDKDHFHNIPIGKPINNSTAYITAPDRENHLQPVGIPGELWVGGDGVAIGYLNDVDFTRERFIDNPFRKDGRAYKTGDLARWLADGNIQFLGRLDGQQVKIRGHRIQLEEIKNHLLKYHEIKDVVVVVIEEENRELAAYIVGDGKISLAELRENLTKALPDYLIPSYLVELEKIPLNPNGKLDRNALPDPVVKNDEVTPSPDDNIQSKLVKIWLETLGVKKCDINPDSDFFQLGGHSLRATIVVNRIRKDIGVTIPLAEIFKQPTIRELAQYIKKMVKKKFIPLQPMEKRKYYRLSSAQKRLYTIQQMNPESTVYNIPFQIVIDGNLEKERIENIFRQLIRRHESLRTLFIIVEDEPVQVIHDNVAFKVRVLQISGKKPTEPMASFVKPFDLANGPLVRCSLVQLGKEKNILWCDNHHIITDGTSLEILKKEFNTLFSGAAAELKPLKVSYKDYSEWQHSKKQQQLMKQQEKYWVHSLFDEIPTLNLPTDYPRPSRKSYAGSTLNFFLNEEETAHLQQISRGYELTLFMTLLAVVNILLSRLSNQWDIIIGIPTVGRRHADLESIIGMFVNTLALRNYPEGDKRLIDFLKEVKENALADFENQDYQFEDLVGKVPVSRDPGRNPIFDVMFALQNQAEYSGEVSGYTEEITKSVIQVSQFDLTLNCVEMGKYIYCSFKYCAKLFKQETIERFIRYFRRIIPTITGEPTVKLLDIEILSETEKNQLLFSFNDTAVDYPEDKTIHELFQEQVKRTPDNIAIVGHSTGVCDPVGFSHVHLSYRELNRESNRLSHRLREIGVGPDTIVAIMVKRSIEMIIGLMGIAKAGGAYLPIDPDSPQHRLTSIMEDAQVFVLIVKNSSIEGFSFTALQNRQSRDGESIITVTPPRPPITDLDSLPFPDISLIHHEKYFQHIGFAMVKERITLQATRGCPFQCAYCHKIWPKTHAVRSAKNIFQEVNRYYQLGIRRFAFVDDIFNLDVKNSTAFFELIIKNKMDKHLQFFFPGGLRGDILTKEYLDLMIHAGTISFALALESASPRLQKYIKKNLNIRKLRENIEYICEKYPQVILELQTMHGFPTETQEEAMLTLNFIKNLKWVHFPYIHILKIYQNCDMEKMALESGIPAQHIIRSEKLAWHELPDTLPFKKSFTLEYQAIFLNEYFLSKERLLHVLPYQMKVLTKEEMIKKYNSYLPTKIDDFAGLLDFLDIKKEDIPPQVCPNKNPLHITDLKVKIKEKSPCQNYGKHALRILLLDLSQLFTSESDTLYDVYEAPLGLMYLLTYLNRELGSKIWGKIAKSRVDFDNYTQLKTLLEEFKPHVIGIRTLTLFKDFFHKTTAMIRHWGIDVPIVAGGPYATSNYKQILQDRNVNLTVLGEGEITFLELIKYIIENDRQLPHEDILQGIPGLAFIPGQRSRPQYLAREIVMLDIFMGRSNKKDVKNPTIINKPAHLLSTFFTSGTTGKPKGVMVDHRNAVNTVTWFGGQYDLQPGSHVILMSDYTFDASINQIFGTLHRGAALHVIWKNLLMDVERLRQYIEKCHIHIINFVPQFLKELLIYHRKLASLQTVISGADRLDNDVKDRILARGYRLYNQYGPTETTVDALAAQCFPGEDVHLGRPIANAKIYVLDTSGNHILLPVGVAGELYIAGAGVARGYLNHPELNVEKFVNRLRRPGGLFCKIAPLDPPKNFLLFGTTVYRTGDLVRWLPEGNIEFLGRIDYQVKINGYRIEIEEIERQLLKIEGIKQAVVIDREENGDKCLCGYIVFNDSDSLNIEDTREKLSENLPGYMIPSHFVVLENIPLNPSGKVNRKALPEAEIEAKGYSAPFNDIQLTLQQLCSEVLNIEKEKIGIDSNFFKLGTHSMHLVRIHNELKKIINKDIDVVKMFEFPTIRTLAHYLKQEEPGKPDGEPERTRELEKGKKSRLQRLQKHKKE